MAALAGEDYSSTNTMLTFVSGSAYGAERCASVTALSDNLVESDEEFSIYLTMAASTTAEISLGNNKTTVIVMDNECTYVHNNSIHYHSFYLNMYVQLQYSVFPLWLVFLNAIPHWLCALFSTLPHC